MIPYLIIGAIVLTMTVLYFLIKNKEDKRNKLIKFISIILFFAAGLTLFYDCAIDQSVKLVNTIFSKGMTAFVFFLRWFTTIVVACGIFYPFYKAKTLKKILEYVMPTVALLNIIFLKQNFIAMYGLYYEPLMNFRTYGMLVQYALLIVLSIVYVFEKIKNKDFKENIKSILEVLLVFVLLMPVFFPQAGLQILLGTYGDNVGGFSGIHRISLYFTALLLILPYIFMRNKSKEQKELFFAILSYSALIQYFYEARTGLGGLPLHLCNTAVVLMFVAFVFKLHGIFYFTYFVNVLGALFAIILPSTESDAFSLHNVHFWYNHIYAVVLPILGVALKVYPRPNLKMMYRAIGFFTLYFVVIVVINAWFNNFESVDYFFVYGDFFVSKLPTLISPLKNMFIFELEIGGLVLKFFYLFQGLVYVVFVALMFVMWMVYDGLFKVADNHYAVHLLKLSQREDLLEIKRLYKGQPLSEPLNKEATKMIKIEHFTKKYAGSKKPSVDDFSLEIHDGEVFGFLGHNGAGKSTTIKSMVGIQSITSGHIYIDGYDVKKQPLEAKLRVGYVSDNHAVYEKLTGREYINYVADLYLVPQEERDARIKKYVEMFNLTDAIDREIKGYSHGMKQKIVVIASLIHNPKVWILDEPLTGLDPTSAFQIKECMRDHANNGNIVFFSSHVIEVVEKICDKICIIQRGKLVCVHAIKDLASQGLTLEQLYMQHVANANYNTSAPDATKVFEKKKKAAVK